MTRIELIEKRQALLQRIVSIVNDSEFMKDNPRFETDYFGCLTLAHRAICDELTNRNLDPIGESQCTSLTQVLRHLERGLNEEPQAHSAFRVAEGLLNRILEDFPTY